MALLGHVILLRIIREDVLHASLICVLVEIGKETVTLRRGQAGCNGGDRPRHGSLGRIARSLVHSVGGEVALGREVLVLDRGYRAAECIEAAIAGAYASLLAFMNVATAVRL